MFMAGLFCGFGLALIVVSIIFHVYGMVQSQERAVDVTVEEVNQWIEDEHISEMDVTIPLVVKEEPKPSAVGDAEVRRRSAVVNEDIS